MAFPQKFIDFSKITFTNCSVTLYASNFDTRSICNVPCGKVINAYWQGNHVVIEMASGWVYNYDDFGHISGRYMK